MVNFVWIVHNAVFAIFYFLDSTSTQSQNEYLMVGVLGLMCVMTVITGCILEILKIILDVIGAVIYIGRFICKYF